MISFLRLLCILQHLGHAGVFQSGTELPPRESARIATNRGRGFEVENQAGHLADREADDVVVATGPVVDRP